MMQNMFSEFDDFTGIQQPLYRKFSILSNCDSSMSPIQDAPCKPVPFIPDDSFDVQWGDSYVTKQAAQMEWSEKQYGVT